MAHVAPDARGAWSNLGPLRPTSDWEVGRKKSLIFLCRSTLSNLSNQFLELIEKGVCMSDTLINAVPPRLLPKRVDTLDRLDRANNDGHFSRPTSDQEVGRG
jgi:hypothetical protein